MKLSDPLLQLEDETNINNYQMAGNIVCTVLDELVTMCVSNACVYDLCKYGDNAILRELSTTCDDIKYKGIAFPTCISLNNMAGYFSPNSDDKTVIKNGDLVKIELGAHVDGFPAIIAYTVIVLLDQDNNNTNNNNTLKKKENVLKAITEASREILNKMKPGNTNIDLMKVLEQCAKKYNCNLPFVNESIDSIGNVAPGVISYEMSQNIINGSNDDDSEFIHRFILSRNNEPYGFLSNENELEENEVYAIDIVMCSGTGKLVKYIEPTIFKRNIIKNKIDLKLQVSKSSMKQFNTPFPLSVRSVQDPKFKLGVKECVTKGLLEPYTPFQEKSNEYIARAKFTVIVKNDPILVTGRSTKEQLKKLKAYGKN